MDATAAAIRLLDDFPTYAEHQLFIKAKDGGVQPFVLNRAQRYIHERLEEQKARTGKVRALLLKGRQQGASTYVSGRFFHKTATNKGVLTFIFAHDSFGSTSLYSMVRMFYEKARNPKWLPALGATNAKELLFPGLMSGYKVGTAGTTGLGRSATFQAVHWSEVAYSPNCEEHAEGLLQTVPDMPGTEIILESTANGQNNFFHRSCMQAMSGVGDFILVFVPWYWQDEYRRPWLEGMSLTPEEGELMDVYGKDGLTLEHLAWRRNKIDTEFQGDGYRFKKEYPFNPQEAFEQSDDQSYIKAPLFIRARATEPIQSQAPLIIGVDPARLGGNKFRLVFRKGRTIPQCMTIPPMRVDEAAERLIQVIRKYSPARVNIDTGGLGVGVLDICVGAGYGKIVKGIAFGSRDVSYPDRYYNKRAEMYGLALDWLNDPPVSVRLEPKDADQLQAELTSVRVARYTGNNQLLLEAKEDMAARGVPSPDLADAFVLTFASSVTDDKNNMAPAITAPIQTTTDWNPFG